MKKFIVFIFILYCYPKAILGQTSIGINISLCGKIVKTDSVLYSDINECFQILPTDSTLKIKSYVIDMKYPNGVSLSINNHGSKLEQSTLKILNELKNNGINILDINMVEATNNNHKKIIKLRTRRILYLHTE